MYVCIYGCMYVFMIACGRLNILDDRRTPYNRGQRTDDDGRLSIWTTDGHQPQPQNHTNDSAGGGRRTTSLKITLMTRRVRRRTIIMTTTTATMTDEDDYYK